MLSTFLIAFSTLFTIVDPIASVPPFLAMTHGDTLARRRRIARKAVLIATVLLLLCGVGGHAIFEFFGITMPAFKLAGGLLLFVVSFQMLHAQHSRVRQTEEEQKESESREDVAVFPLAIPLLAGPGAMASVFILMERAKNWVDVGFVYLGIVLTMVLSLVILSFAPRVSPYLGTIGMNVMTRVMGLILAAISMQFVIDALLEAFPILLGK